MLTDIGEQAAVTVHIVGAVASRELYTRLFADSVAVMCFSKFVQRPLDEVMRCKPQAMSTKFEH